MKNRLLLPLAAALAALTLAAAFVGTAGGAPVQSPPDMPGWLQSSKDIAAVIEGRTHYREREDGTREIEYHTKDGRVAYEFDGCIVAGKWWLEDNVVCYAYPEMTGNMAHCFWLRMDRGQLQYWSTSEPQATEPLAVTLDNLAGNTENLALGASGKCQDI
jgi:hypothetical protein